MAPLKEKDRVWIFFHVQGLSTNPDGFVAFYQITVAQSPPASGAEGRRMGGCYLR